jgi:glutathione S-transferase
MARYRLHCIGASGNSYKLALYMNCAGLDWEPVGVDFAGGQTRDISWRAGMNAMGEVPVLEVDGQLMSQSGAILIWLAETTGKFAPSAEQRHEALRWIMFDNHKFTNNHAMHRFQKSFMPEPVHPAGFDIAADYPALHAWRERLAALPGWKPPYDMMPVGSDLRTSMLRPA